MPDRREADTRLLTCLAVLSVPEEGSPAEARRRPAAERLREQLGPALHARLLGAHAARPDRTDERPTSP